MSKKPAQFEEKDVRWESEDYQVQQIILTEKFSCVFAYESATQPGRFQLSYEVCDAVAVVKLVATEYFRPQGAKKHSVGEKISVSSYRDIVGMYLDNDGCWYAANEMSNFVGMCRTGAKWAGYVRVPLELGEPAKA